MQLEDEIGQTLFIRGNKNMTLTKEGLLFKNRAEEILSLYHKAISELSQDQEIFRVKLSQSVLKTVRLRIMIPCCFNQNGELMIWLWARK